MTKKFKIIISDFHMGPGDFTAQNPLEDFNSDAEFVTFIDAVIAESTQARKDAELIINGDFLEFLQVPAVDNFDPLASYPPSAYTDTGVTASLKQLNIIIQNHPKVFGALADFLNATAPIREITILSGNHDPNLYWQAVQTRFREAVGALGRRRNRLNFVRTFINRENIYVEHGNQRTEKMNRFPNFEVPIDADDASQIYLPPGSNFVINYFNVAEREAWWIDSVKPFTSLIWFTLQWDFDLAIDLLLGFLAHSPGLLLGSFSADSTTPNSDMPMVAQLEDDSQRADIAKHYAEDDDFRHGFHRQIYNVLHPTRTLKNAKAFTALGNAIAMAQSEQKSMRTVLSDAAQEIITQGKAKAVFFGHTHHPVIKKFGADGYYVNTGAWLWSEDFDNAAKDQWFALFNHPEQFQKTKRLPFARVDYDKNGNPTPQLLDYSGRGFPPPPPKNIFAHLWDWILKLFGAK